MFCAFAFVVASSITMPDGQFKKRINAGEPEIFFIPLILLACPKLALILPTVQLNQTVWLCYASSG